tara:strand:+ start:9535 stop:10716 length:1182 start_codon:yes stop_codon:yes gene_type:complete
MTEDQNMDQDFELHDDENEIMEMKHGSDKMKNRKMEMKHDSDMKKRKLMGMKHSDKMEMKHGGEEEDSIKSADMATDMAKDAPKRKMPGGTAADNTMQEPMPKTKAGMLQAMMHSAGKMKKQELMAMYGSMKKQMMQASYHEDVDQEDFDHMQEIAYEADFEEDLNALVAEEATLSDEFKAKAETIFEAAIKSRLSSEIDRLEEKYNEELSEEIATTKADLVDKVDSYLNYVVEQWMDDNKVAVQAGLRTEIAEKFMNSLKDLFVESYIDVPESKVDLVDELAEEVDELETKLNESTGKIIEMTEELENFKRNEVIREASKDLAETQIEKLKKLVSDIDFSDNFAQKVATVKESYFNKPAAAEVVTEEDDMFEVETSDVMGQYLSAIKKQNKS